jgi:hypothetical protein
MRDDIKIVILIIFYFIYIFPGFFGWFYVVFCLVVI